MRNSSHNIKNKIELNFIDEHALSILKRLQQAGYQAYLVGGCVRDLLLHQKPKDFDIATDAIPHQIKQVFNNCRLIGRRFLLAHIYFGHKIIEVSTFRGPHHQKSHTTTASGLIIDDNVYGTIEEDAFRRDFTINALYYDPFSQKLVDYVDGLNDIQNKVVRAIGDATTRYREDPVRMLRALRFSAKLNFTVEGQTLHPIQSLSYLIHQVAAARLFDELIKLLHCGQALPIYQDLKAFNLLPYMLGPLYEIMQQNPATDQFIAESLLRTDQRIAEQKSVTPAFLFAMLLWPCVANKWRQCTETEKSDAGYNALEDASYEVLQQQHKLTTIPRYFSHIIREIWRLQYHLTERKGKKPLRTLAHPRFRAGYDLLLLRLHLKDVEEELCHWWAEFQHASPAQQKKMLTQTKKRRKKR